MNFGQALAALIGGRSITRSGWQRQGMSLAMQQPTGLITNPFIVQQVSNGDCWSYTPTQADILATDWGTAGEIERGVTQAQHEHAGAHS